MAKKIDVPTSGLACFFFFFRLQVHSCFSKDVENTKGLWNLRRFSGGIKQALSVVDHQDQFLKHQIHRRFLKN